MYIITSKIKTSWNRSSQTIFNKIRVKDIDINDLGPVKWLFGAQITYTLKSISINQSIYIKNILTKFKFMNVNTEVLSL